MRIAFFELELQNGAHADRPISIFAPSSPAWRSIQETGWPDIASAASVAGGSWQFSPVAAWRRSDWGCGCHARPCSFQPHDHCRDFGRDPYHRSRGNRASAVRGPPAGRCRGRGAHRNERGGSAEGCCQGDDPVSALRAAIAISPFGTDGRDKCSPRTPGFPVGPSHVNHSLSGGSVRWSRSSRQNRIGRSR